MSQIDHGDQPDLLPALEATQAALEEGIPLGQLSARARTASAEADALIEAIRLDNEWRHEHKAPAHPVEQPLTEWIRSVEARLSARTVPAAAFPASIPMRLPCPRCGELHEDVGEFATKPHHTHACQYCGEVWRPAVVHTVGVRFLPGFKNEPADAAGSGDSTGEDSGTATGPRAGTALPRDATTAALERAGAVMAAQQSEVSAPAAEQPGIETCSRCGKPVRINGRTRSCEPCSVAWSVPEKRVPLAQSSWVPDEDPGHDDGWHPTYADWIAERDHARAWASQVRTLQQRVRELEAVVEGRQNAATHWRERALKAEMELATTSDRARKNDAELARMKAANTTQAPAAPSNRALIAKACIQAVIAATDEWRSGREPSDAAVRRAAMNLRDALLDCGKQERIEFRVKEVLP